MKKVKAVALLSGGLDSTLAIKVVLDQGIEVIAVNFTSPFCLCNHRNGCKNEAKKVVDKFGIDLRMFYIVEEYLEIVKAPKYGYGRNMNPCIDCRILMFKKAGQFMRKVGASFLITGEVLGQRPKSQHRASLGIIDKESRLKGLILRPLSAKLLSPTIPEQEGWVDRNRLLDIHGRSRKPQIQLAREYNVYDYPCPAGGCLLTDKGFSRRITDLIEHDRFLLEEINILKVGRHFRFNPKAKLVVGRDEKENNRLSDLVNTGDIYFNPVEDNGPVAVGRGEFDKDSIINASKIVARYTDGNGKLKICSFMWPEGKKEEFLVQAMEDSEIQGLRI